MGEGSGRHPALVKVGSSYFNRHTGEWRDLTDDDRRAKLWELNLKFRVPKSEQEFSQIWEWIVMRFRRDRDQKWEVEAEQEAAREKKSGYIPELNGNLYYQTNTKPPKFIVAHSETKRLIELTIRSFESKSGNSTGSTTQRVTYRQSITVRPFTACFPGKTIHHNNPLSYLLRTIGEKFTIQWHGMEGSACVTTRNKTIGESVDELRQSGNVMADFGVDIALAMILKEYERKGLIEENQDMDLSGFFHDQNKKLIVSNVNTTQPTTEALKDAIACISDAQKYYIGREALLSSTIHWFMVAPLSFVTKQLGRDYLKWLVFSGVSNATKTTTGLIGLAIDGHHNDPDFMKGQGAIDTVARLGDFISKATFPKVVNEVNLVSDDRDIQKLLEYIKTAIESLIFRDKFASSRSASAISIPALSPLVLTSNYPLPVYNTAFMKRIVDRDFPSSESHNPTSDEAIELKQWKDRNLDRLAALGQFRNWYVSQNPEIVREASDLGKELLAKAFEYGGVDWLSWLDLELEQNQLEDSLSDNKADVRRAFEAYITNVYDRALSSIKPWKSDDWVVTLPTGVTNLLKLLLEYDRLPDIKILKTDRYTIIISKGILQELYKQGVGKDQLPNLRALADYIPGSEFYKSHGTKVVKVSKTDLDSYLGGFDQI